MLWVRSLDALEARPLVGTEDGILPFWSPDGGSLAFFAGNELRRLSLTDGTVQRICTVPGGGLGGGDWGEGGTILFSAGGGSGRIYSVAATGGDAKALTTPDDSRSEQNHHMPQFLPDGRRFLFTVTSTQDESSGLHVASLDAPENGRQIVPSWVRRLYAARHLLFVREGALLAQPFDPDRAEPSGEPIAIAPSVVTWSANAAAGWFGVSPGGTLAFFSGESVSGQVQLAWVDRRGQRLGAVGAPGHYGQIALSPDERNVALEIPDADGHFDLWVMDVARGVTSRVTATPGDERDPVWTADSRSLTFIARREGEGDLLRKGLRASDPETVLVDSPHEDIPESFSRDGGTLLFLRRVLEDDSQSAWALPLEEGGAAEPILTDFRVDETHLSPDGRWFAYVSNESGRDEVYLEAFRREGDRVRVSTDGGGQPKWRGDGKELFYTTPTGVLMAVEVRTPGDRLDVSLPTELFEIQGLQGTGYDDYSASADGQRFLIKQPVEEGREPRLQIVTNWTSLLE